MSEKNRKKGEKRKEKKAEKRKVGERYRGRGVQGETLKVVET